MVWIKTLAWLLLSAFLITVGMVLLISLALLTFSGSDFYASLRTLLPWLPLLVFGLSLTGALFFGLLTPLVVQRGLNLQRLGATPREQLATTVANELAQRLGMPAPQLYQFSAAVPNAFVLGMGRQHAWLVLSSGLLQSASDAELRAAIAHEMAHVYFGDMSSMQLLLGTSIVVAFAVAQILTMLFHTPQQSRSILLSALQVVIFLFALLPIAWFSRRREYAADRFAAEQYGAAGMISLLRRRASANTQDDCCGPLAALATFGESGGILAGHPTLEQRIAALQRKYLALKWES